jgi:hemolysin D
MSQTSTAPEAPAPAAPPPKPASPKAAPRIVVKGSDREFLPAALELLETPPSPLAIATLLTICAFFAALLVWSYFGRLDVDAVAPGKIETEARTKVIQPLEPGKIASIAVKNGSRVKAGDLLLELDPTEARADADASKEALDASLAEVARRRYAIDGLRQIRGAFDEETPTDKLLELVAKASERIAFDPATSVDARLREIKVLTADIDQLTTALLDIDKQAAEKKATLQRLDMSIAFQNTLMKTLTDRVSTRQQAIDKAVGTKIELYDAKEELEKAQSALASDQGQEIETEAALTELKTARAKAYTQFIADYENKLADASRKADEAQQMMNKAEARLARLRIVSPIDGIVQQSAVTNVGQVFTTGQQLMVITPIGGTLQVQALIANADIGFIKLGQDVVVKVDAFPFTRFGVLHGKVAQIASAAVDEQEAKRVFANAAAAANDASASPASAPGQTESFVFPVTISLDEDAMKFEGGEAPLAPGMTVAIEIKTDSRRAIDYFLSPLAKLGRESLHEQ